MDEGEERHANSPLAKRTVLGIVATIAILYLAASLYLISDLYSRLGKLEHSGAAAATAATELRQQLGATQADLRASTEALASKVGLTQRQLELRSADIKRRQAALKRQQEAAEQRLSEQQRQQVASVTGEVANVKTDLGNVHSEVAATRSALQAAEARLERAIGDLGIQSGLIARTRDELEVLKHKGDRNYYEFTLEKKRPVPVSTVSLQLKKADPKKSKFTLEVLADDRKIEKKDRNLGEPVQFYTGHDRQLYELVVFGMEKSRVTGYLSTPKTAAAQAGGGP